MLGDRPQRVFLRFSPRSVPLPLILLAAGTGVVSGFYLFDGLVKSGVERAVLERRERDLATAPSAPASSATPPSAPAPTKQ